MRMDAMDIYRPTRTADNRGGSTTVLGEGKTIWGQLVIHKEETSFVVDAREDVELGDIIVITEEEQ